MLRVVLFSVTAALILVAASAQDAEEEEEGEDEDYETEPPPPDGPPLAPMCDLVTSYGYKCEEYVVTTKDGYKHDLYHILCDAKPKGPVILLVHGLMASGEVYVLKNQSVAYLLCDAGVDPWITNMRGTLHGRKHEKLNPDTDEEFWDISFTDMAQYDIPASINFVKEKTKTDKIYYYGHSLGTTVFFAMLSMNPEVANSIKEAIIVAPVVYATKFQFMIKEGSSMHTKLTDTMDGFKKNKLWEAFPRADVPQNEHQIHCENMPEMAVGYCKMGFDMAKPVVGDFMPAGTSRKNIEHLAQTYMKGKISFFDYGPEENKKRYKGSATPPEIDVKKAITKVHLFYCEADQVVGVPDVETLKNELPNPGIAYYIKDETFNHVDYLFPMSEDTEKPFLDLMEKIKEIIK